MATTSQELIVITSAPATGKTYWISSYSKVLPGQSILVISPLRALADECREAWGRHIIVMTPEEWMVKRCYSDIVIFDEFHLFFYWGDSFRPLMWEVFYELSSRASLVFVLTATLSPEIKKEMAFFSTQFDIIILCDHGNQKLKFKPFRYVRAYSQKWIQQEILSEEKSTCTRLIFCRYRAEVFKWEEKLRARGFNCVSCVGGESKWMKQKLAVNPIPDFIISTTVLSHGVNLPEISRVYFLYQVDSMDFWIQMVARGGRKGERFDVIGLDNPHGLNWNRLHNLLNIIWLTLRRNCLLVLNFVSK